MLNGLVTWAWERYHNVLSWYIRPLLILPLAPVRTLLRVVRDLPARIMAFGIRHVYADG